MLYVVSTPIGNLEDITLRALRVLREASLVVAEDTRRTAKLLRHYEIETPTTSFHDHNERRKLHGLLRRLAQGDTLALVSDAGTPVISDPGFRLVRAARAAGVRVEAVPGPSAVLAALVSSGLPADTFTFLGYPPRKGAERARWLERLAAEPRTVVIFEAPHRLRKTLEDLANILGDRHISVAKELTKVHETVFTGTTSESFSVISPIQGEFVVSISGFQPNGEPGRAPSDDEIADFFGQKTEHGSASRRDSVVATARHFGQSARAIYSALERVKKRGESPDP